MSNYSSTLSVNELYLIDTYTRDLQFKTVSSNSQVITKPLWKKDFEIDLISATAIILKRFLTSRNEELEFNINFHLYSSINRDRQVKNIHLPLNLSDLLTFSQYCQKISYALGKIYDSESQRLESMDVHWKADEKNDRESYTFTCSGLDSKEINLESACPSKAFFALVFTHLNVYLKEFLRNVSHFPLQSVSVIPCISKKELQQLKSWSESPTEKTVMDIVAVYFKDSPITISNSANYTLYILDSHLNPVPVGVKGELCIGGPGLALGYINTSEVTEQKYSVLSKNIFDDNIQKSEKIYHTGDLCRYNKEGNIEFLEKEDTPLNQTGYRIESGKDDNEIERSLEYIIPKGNNEKLNRRFTWRFLDWFMTHLFSQTKERQ